ncbi:MAG: 4Fe-4S binding protein [bacterium]|nr:4Fe-4S binding protein [bacterium]MDD5756786.1 4Fe-4S binding protein [bacterium]
MKRQIITINEKKCTGCGLCATGCPEGAIQIIKGKARLVGDLLCDGLGACIGTCPEDAITIIEREAEPYEEKKVMSNIVKQGPEVLQAHLEHLKAHNQQEYLKQAFGYMKEKGIKHTIPCGCPGTKMMDMRKKTKATERAQGDIGSQLRQWPVQMHLISPAAPYFQGADVLLVADCVAYALGGFHADHLKNKSLAIACPKLDSSQDEYVAKIKSWIEEAKINTLTVMIMQVPCCNGLVRLVQQAMEGVTRKVPVKKIVVGIEGQILSEEWL